MNAPTASLSRCSAARSARKAARRRARRRGFTLVEVMVALAVLAIGVTGILGMQNAAIHSNRRAQEVTVATQISRLWLERLRLDATQWNRPSQRQRVSDLRDTQTLCRLHPMGCISGGGNTPGVWFVPTIPALASTAAPATLELVGTGGSAFDSFGREVGVASPNAMYCVGVRLNWIAPDLGSRQGIIRAEVRVWWFREGALRSTYTQCGFNNAGQQAAISSDSTNISAIYAASAIQGMPL